MQEQLRLRREVVRLKREMNAVSAQDEFSKWAKLRRQHDKALEEHDKKGTHYISSKDMAKRKNSFTDWSYISVPRVFLPLLIRHQSNSYSMDMH